MREIEFRGIRKGGRDDGKWVYGLLFPRGILIEPHYLEEYWIATGFENECYPVIPETIGQYTGLKDCKGNKIYEGDILRNPPKSDWEKINYVAFEVFWHDNDCADNHIGWQIDRRHYYGCLAGGTSFEKFLPKYTSKMVIIGNIHERPELLEEAQ